MLLAANASIDISPAIPTYLGCGAEGLVPPAGPGKLEAGILHILDELGNQVLFITLDALYVGPGLVDSLREHLSELLGAHQIIVASSHTHTAPMLDRTKPQMGAVEDAHFEIVLERIIESSINLINGSHEEVEVIPKKYEHRHSSFRRRILPIAVRPTGVGIFRAQPLPSLRPFRGVTSEIAEVKSLDGKVLATIWVMPTHPVGLPSYSQISAHYIGEVRTRLRSQHKSQSHSLIFLQGASGDIRPPAFHPAGNSTFDKLQKLLFGRINGRFTSEEYSNWVDSVWSELKSATDSPSWKAQIARDQTISTSLVELPLEDFFHCDMDGFGDRALTFQQVCIADLTFIGISAEPTWALRKALLKGHNNTTLFGCLGDTFGYLPSPSQTIFGGYEVSGYLPSFSLIKKQSADRRILKKLSEFLNANNS